ncbi:endolytic transglycosylase MltG [Anaerospora sp.]|jgi:UPF0755 protein|uniref:endolytic transglycosylase MltG n=1 Tax=Anaerospora sp. TaxID=1960278 RepID=UPI00289A7A66|nr:endolytic transglycosylase MltG [Anaerospora sp.]MDF2927865.1 putative aminodeoxychorismate lyase [Anaerospora sp.]
MQLSNSLMTKSILAVAVISFFIAGLLYGAAQPISFTSSEPVTIIIKQGMSANEIAALLRQQGLIKNTTLFRMYVHWSGFSNSLQAGEYTFTPDMNMPKMITMLAKGEVSYSQITIPEGLTIEQIAALLESKQIANAAKFKAAAKDYQPFAYIDADTRVGYKPEGFLFPDTYRVPRGIKEEELLQFMVSEFDRNFTPQMREKAKKQGLTIREVMILASLVEKEARIEKDRPVIAGVFLNRIRQAMPLQSCATIQYLLGYPKAELTIKDTEIPSPYNTYLNMGLPPGPIANAGTASIMAVLEPALTDYLYFVADNEGVHHFSKTYDEHLITIEQVSQ